MSIEDQVRNKRWVIVTHVYNSGTVFGEYAGSWERLELNAIHEGATLQFGEPVVVVTAREWKAYLDFKKAWNEWSREVGK